MRFLILTLLLSSCSYFARDKKAHAPSINEALAAKKEFYCNEGKRVLAARGYMDDRCDSLLFTSLFSVACGPIDLSSWEDPEIPGKWHRNPQRDCFINGQPNGSASSISKDMFLGLWHHLFSTKDSQNIKEIVDYGQSHNWVMGEAQDNTTLLSRCLLTPQMISLVKEMDGSVFGLTQNQDGSDDAGPVQVGYQAHLAVLRILLSGRVRGAISDLELSTLKDQAVRQPQNALYVAAYEKYAGGAKATGLLLDETHFPGSRLPNNHQEHCTSYLHSSDIEDDTDWKPCPNEPFKELDGVDFVFAAWVILNK